MPPGGGGEGEHGCTAQEHPPATVRVDEDALPHCTPPLPAIAQVDHQEKRQRHPEASLPEGPLVEILARVPYSSLCRFRCVSKPWLALCSSRDIIKRSPQTLSGFFYYGSNALLSFRNLSGRGLPQVDSSLPFLRERYKCIFVKEFCSGLLLCKCWELCSMRGESHYVVCNPATEEWTVLPPVEFTAQDLSHAFHIKPVPMLYLGFDAAVPSRFVVFAPLTVGCHVSGKMAIFSSETGQWTYVQSKWSSGTAIDHACKRRVFLNGTLHLTTLDKSIVTVDMEGKVWREIKMPDGLPTASDIVSIGQSQGRLYVWQVDNTHDCQLYIWVLEDYGTGKWALKHTVNVLELFGRHRPEDADYYMMFAIHPDCNVVFLTNMKKETTVSYDLDKQKVHVICTEFMCGLPYIPCFAELPSAGH
ncbi:F-box protein At5g49610 isoform X1 [Lolium perenne]|uniref:F-box protein At5g49610 isoform X1 n=1 Tax=Lolium perenne TaxID=4522 RepID=UPI0021F60507|nr:F-box protein At5g07610-like isoform X1 [Lolium perenne]